MEDHRTVLVHAGLAQQAFQLLAAGDVAPDRVDQISVPAKVRRAGASSTASMQNSASSVIDKRLL